MNSIKVYLDTCCYNRPYDDQTQLRINLEAQAKLFIQKQIVDGKLELIYSFISVYENSQNPYSIRKNAISDFFSNASIYISEDNVNVIKQRASEIMKTGIKTKDALHISCAIEGKADYFVTTDIRLLKYSSDEVKIINPIDLITILEG
ncbi:MAG: type II toxin-antitoxin system VapC family toxin [Lachnospiraceae bacterium]|nr:type II toxin-antitoxin system VapC family toxin [Lachnospiraceae bacterium]